MLCHGDNNQDLQNKEIQEVKKCDINLERIFQIADEVMQTPSNSFLVRVTTPEKPGPVSVPSSNTCNAMLYDNPASTVKANPLCGPIIMAVSDNANLVTCEQKEEYVVSVSEQMPEDAIFEVSLYIADFLKVFTLIISIGKKLCQERLGEVCPAVCKKNFVFRFDRLCICIRVGQKTCTLYAVVSSVPWQGYQ